MLSINCYNKTYSIKFSEYQNDSKKNVRNSTRYPGLYNNEIDLNEFDDNSSEEFYDSPEYTPGNIQSETDEEIEIDKSFGNHYDTCIEENSNHSVAEFEEQTNDTSGNNFQKM